MKKTFKRFLAFAMVAVMMANPVSVLAAETTEETTSPAIGSADASGDVEGFVDTTIFKVVLPTSADGTFDFIMDPQGLIDATSGEAYTGATFEDNATVFFNTASANASGDYKSTSNYIEVLNRGTVAVNVSVEATVTGLNNITMASSDSAFTSGDAAVPELYLAFIASGDCTSGGAAANTTPILTTGSGTTAKTTATIEATMPAASADFYEFNYASGNYTFDLKADKASGDATIFPDYSFALTGACNSEADWTDAKNDIPDVQVIWTLEDAEAASPTPSVPTTATFTKGTVCNIPVNLGSDDTAATRATVTTSTSLSGTYAANAKVTYDATSNSIVINSTAWASSTSAGDTVYLKVKFDDSAATVAYIAVTVAE